MRFKRIGHCGTLDPLASGILLLCVGPYTRLSPWLTGGEKVYTSRFRLGSTSDSGDSCGTVQEVEGAVQPSLEEIEACLGPLRGEIEQVPPAFSAIKINGVPAYKLARQNKEVEMRPRQVRVYAFEITAYEFPDLDVRIACSAGTYIRSLAIDLGHALGCGAHLTQLRRVRLGGVDIGGAYSMDRLEAEVPTEGIGKFWVHPREALENLPAVEIDGPALERLKNGNALEMEMPGEIEPGREVAVYDSGRIWAVAKALEGGLKPVKVFPCGSG